MAISTLDATRSEQELLRRGKLVTNKNFQLILLPTEQCNFRCVYCYEDFAVGRMKQEVVQGVKALLDRRSLSLHYLNLSWFGGEPLLAKDIILDVAGHATELARKSQFNYSSNITTNGYHLDMTTATALVQVGVNSYQISLDGPPDVHNRTRRRADGSGTFERIWTNLMGLRASSLPVRIMLRVHFSADTCELLNPLVDALRDTFLDDPRFSVFFKGVEHLGGPNDAEIRVLSKAQQAAVIARLQARLRGGDSSPVNIHEIGDDYVCYAARPNSLMIRANGDVGKCTVILNDERNKVATLRPDGTLALVPGRLGPWVRGIESLDP
ncbi:MAG: radical SAM protein, partial [Gemmatimonadaceae bacterium]|nr:radical SAM protein [Gloeobacterales cyanobacterium ES-bin-141]